MVLDEISGLLASGWSPRVATLSQITDLLKKTERRSAYSMKPARGSPSMCSQRGQRG